NENEREIGILKEMIIKLKKKQEEEIKEDISIKKGLNFYVNLEGSDNEIYDIEKKKSKIYDIHENILKYLEKKELNNILLLQGESGSGKTLYCRYLEKYLWDKYQFGYS